MLFRTSIIVVLFFSFFNEGRSSTFCIFGLRTFRVSTLCVRAWIIWKENCLKRFLFFSLSSLLFSFVLYETINTTMIMFGTAAFTRPAEQEVVQVPEEKEVSYKNINSYNCYETNTTRVVASLCRESFSDVCIYDCCIFVYHILFS